MKTKALFLIAALLGGTLEAQNINVQKTSGTNDITGDLNIDTSRTLKIDDAGTFAIGTTTPATIGGTNGAANITAAGTNQNITLTPSGTGYVSLNNNGGTVVAPSAGSTFQMVGSDAANAQIEINSFAGTPRIIARRAQGTIGSPTAVQSGNVIFNAQGRGYVTSASAGYVGGGAGLNFTASQNWTTTANGTGFNVTIVGDDTTTSQGGISIDQSGKISGAAHTVGRSLNAWTTTGAYLQLGAGIITDRTSSGTVATATGAAFAQPTFAAVSATTFTDFANGYFAGPPIRGTNVTGGTPWTLWLDSGDLRTDGNIVHGDASTFTIQTNVAQNVVLGYNSSAAVTISSAGATGMRFNGYGAGALNTDGSGNITAISDGRMKDIQGDYTAGLAEILKVHPKVYKWNKASGLDRNDVNAGFIAQDLMAAGLDQAVFTQRSVDVMEEVEEDVPQVFRGDDGQTTTIMMKQRVTRQKRDQQGEPVKQRVAADYYSISDRAVMAAMINAIKELNAKNQALQEENADQDAYLAALAAALGAAGIGVAYVSKRKQPTT